MDVGHEVSLAMQETNDRFSREVVGARNFAELDHVYTTAAILLPPEAPLVRGREAIRDFWKTGIASLDVTGASLTTLTAEMAGDTVIEIGLAQLNLGNHGLASLKYIVHWKQEDGRWLWDKDIWNMN